MIITLLTILCGFALLFLFLLGPGESQMDQRAAIWGRYIAHRGLHTPAIPENSLAAFTAAVDEGYAIELDIRLTKDGQVVVFHDDELFRLCGVEGCVEEKTYEELQACRLLDTDQRIPLLSEVLAIVDEQVPLLIEWKPTPRYKDLCNSAWRILRRYDGDLCVQSFDPRILRMFKKHAPGCLRGQLAMPPENYASPLTGYLLGNLFGNFLSRPHFISFQSGRKPVLVQLVEKFTMRVVWTARAEEEGKALEAESDAIVFEHYTPELYFKDQPIDPDIPDATLTNLQ